MASKRLTCPKPVKFIEDKDGKFPIVRGQGINGGDYSDAITKLAVTIRTENSIPEEFYRKSDGEDHLLKNEGWMHLHLDDDVLLIIEETEAFI